MGINEGCYNTLKVCRAVVVAVRDPTHSPKDKLEASPTFVDVKTKQRAEAAGVTEKT